ncbi:biotin/lipoyl-containing protein [Anaerosalibacter massiliensis]|uniref:Biotin/lipoyl-binding protein n=1 Tax=Anaerosalibacter massiliensis TaxID=1347392 RepID=A0A9X2MM42_9FIRM|nr:biotin/lipoyl-containing protein [Anaerosalibacter massiliensis]MCR2045657.1 biotin/lipoyl-binding protein [Anaerosalibacter massiliensis]
MKNYLIRVNGNEYEVEVEEISNSKNNSAASSKIVEAPKPNPAPKAAPKPQPKQEVNIPQGAESIEAPMPGTILSINVNEGDEVKAGEVLLILEAMKMENEILSPRDGKVAAMHTEKGASVSTGDKLVSIE